MIVRACGYCDTPNSVCGPEYDSTGIACCLRCQEQFGAPHEWDEERVNAVRAQAAIRARIQQTSRWKG